VNRESIGIRIAEPKDWPGIWPVLLRVVRAGDTYMFDPNITEAEARDTWLFTSDPYQ
jgi:hypothetical protein